MGPGFEMTVKLSGNEAPWVTKSQHGYICESVTLKDSRNKVSDTWPLAVISKAWAGIELSVLLTHDTTLGETAVGLKF